MPENTLGQDQRAYEIFVRGLIGEDWRDWLNGSVVKLEKPDGQVGMTKVIIGRIDQAALRGLLNKLWDLNLEVLSVSELSHRKGAAND